jgi:hypothetical protein
MVLIYSADARVDADGFLLARSLDFLRALRVLGMVYTLRDLPPVENL